jgi:hypothetical protein
MRKVFGIVRGVRGRSSIDRGSRRGSRHSVDSFY